MKHCGSTLCMNIIKYTLSEMGYSEKQDGTFHKNDCYYKVFKFHEIMYAHKTDFFSKPTIVVMPIRDIRDSCISNFFRFHYDKKNHLIDTNQLAFFYGLPLFLNSMLENIWLYYQWLPHVSLFFIYEEYYMNPLSTVHALLHDVFPKDAFHDDFVNTVIEKCFHSFDDTIAQNLKDYRFLQPANLPLLTMDHNTSGGMIEKYVDFFSDIHHELILKNENIKNWLKANGYTIFTN